MRLERGDPPALDFEALADALRAEGFEVELAGPDESSRRVRREDVAGVWQVLQVVLDHLERDAEELIVLVLAAWAADKISRDDDPEPDADETPPKRTSGSPTAPSTRSRSQPRKTARARSAAGSAGVLAIIR